MPSSLTLYLKNPSLLYPLHEICGICRDTYYDEEVTFSRVSSSKLVFKEINKTDKPIARLKYIKS